MHSSEQKANKRKRKGSDRGVHGGGGRGERRWADITDVTKSTAPGAELYGGTSGMLN